ncbi:MAG: UDP-N-acetyl-D-glucosamine dehydrogenase [Candidatus Rokuibacteriota bacterium]|nr:MAG: UDP-N-acetyl-D-glucosamine dehydrogenase [Candidatus Rokubacteria bacterium]
MSTTMSPSDVAESIRSRTARITVIGQGYVGLPLAVEFARAGFAVTGLDTDPDRVAALNLGQSHSPDVARQDLETQLREGRYAATSDLSALARSDVVLICVPTPLRKSKEPDISFVVAAAEEVAARVRPGQLVILESTTYPGTTEELLLPMFQARGARVGVDLFLAFSPERIDPANPTFSVRDITKVVGGVTPACTDLAALLYRQIIGRVVEVSSATVAELAKLYENVFRNVNIALANEFALMCERLGVSSKEVIDAAATKPFGFMAFYPGPGIGGHCIPVDPLYLSWKMRLSGYEARFIALADEINRGMPGHVVRLVAEALNDVGRALKGARVLVLGVAYKRGVGDTRESPAFEVISALRTRGAVVTYTDPYVPTLRVGETDLKAVELTREALQEADCVLILTNHPEFDYDVVASEARLIVDTRQAIPTTAGGNARVVRL